MYRVELDTWGHTVSDLETAAVEADHPRTRQRILFLLALVTQGLSASKAAVARGLRPETGISWVRNYNERGLEALRYRTTGGRRPFFRMSR
jgi:transposase